MAFPKAPGSLFLARGGLHSAKMVPIWTEWTYCAADVTQSGWNLWFYQDRGRPLWPCWRWEKDRRRPKISAGKGKPPKPPPWLSSGYPWGRKVWQLLMRTSHAPFPDSEAATRTQLARKGGRRARTEEKSGSVRPPGWTGTASEPPQPRRGSYEGWNLRSGN